FGLTEGPVTPGSDEPHSTRKQAQKVPFPCAVAGRFVRPRQIDWYRFRAKKNELIWIEAIGERDGEAMDLEIVVQDGGGHQLATLTDFGAAPPKGAKKGAKETTTFPLGTLDAMGLVKATSDSDIYILVRDLYGSTLWGVERTYRLIVEPSREQVRVVA